MPEEHCANNCEALAPATPIIETAGGTTDPDNANSGSGVYVLFAVVVALLILATFALASCVGAIGSYVASDIAQNEGIELDFDRDPLDDLERLLENETYYPYDDFMGWDFETAEPTARA